MNIIGASGTKYKIKIHKQYLLTTRELINVPTMPATHSLPTWRCS